MAFAASATPTYGPIPQGEILQLVGDSPPETADYFYQHTMYRIKDPRKSVPFYTNVLGMKLLKQMDFDSEKSTIYYMAYKKHWELPKDESENAEFAMSTLGCLELIHRWGSELEPTIAFHNGNTEPKGFGHIGIHVPNVEKACERFELLGIPFIKKADTGNIKGVAVIQDPDGYFIEIFNPKNILYGQEKLT